jgi:hypothetical protein
VTNKAAQQHIDKAKGYADRGEKLYGSAADEMIAAQKSDPTLGYEAIGKRMGRSEAWVGDLVRWRTKGGVRPSPFARDDYSAETQTRAKKVAREQPEALVEDPETRRSLTRALDKHYTEQAKQSAKHKRDKEVERKGGEDEYADHQHRQHIAEVVSVARGATSGWRFVAGQLKSLDLDSGAADELTALADETEGFLSMFRSVLAGEEISDSDLAELLKEEA